MPPAKKQKTARNARSSEADGAAQEGGPTRNPDPSSSSAIVPSWKGAKRRRTSLEKFVDGPVDIVVEVLALLHPRDFCTLVRTSSVFKNFLLSKARRRLWKTVIANATDLPPQPPWLSEPAFVHLLYSNHCHNCGMVTRQAITEWFTRACSKCILMPEVSNTWGSAWLSITVVGQWKGSELYKIFDLVQTGEQPSGMNYYHHDGKDAYRCSKTDLDRYLEQLRKVKENPDWNERAKAYEAIVEEWMQGLTERQKYSSLLRRWFDKEEHNRLADLDGKRDQRFTEIIQRLQKSEWAKEIQFLSVTEVKEISTFPVVRRSCKLTKGEWLKVLVALDGFLNKTRDRRLLAEREATIRARLRNLGKAMLDYYVQLPRTAAMDVRPPFIEFALMDKCKALADAPVEQSITREDFLAILPELHKTWHMTAKTRLVRAVQKHLRTPSVSINTRDPLNLAVVVFACEHCGPFTCMRYPAVLAHRCGYVSYHGRLGLDEDCKDVYTNTARRLHVTDDLGVWKPERFSLKNLVGVGRTQDTYCRALLEPMCQIVRALGLNPSTATAADLEACDARLRCASCVADGGPDTIYRWDAALAQFRRHHALHGKWKWKRVYGAHQMKKVRELEAARDTRPFKTGWSRSAMWACSLCADWDGSGHSIKIHLRDQHGLSDLDACVRNGTIYVHPAKNAALVRPSVILLPGHGISR